MKKTTVLLAALLLASVGMAAVQSHAAETGKEVQVITRVGTRPSGVGSHTTFTGNVRHDPLFSPNEAAPYSVSYVTFEPGARSFWHTHPAGQRLVVVSGSGLTGTWDGRVAEIKAGAVVWCAPDIKPWHGASPTTAMTHMALTGMKDGKNVTWMEEVSDQQYNAK
ncbi:(R)-mandelonitrile lyase [Bilophila wadsworthia]|uniref:(R)-mandelonitrile lyase n=1 Tax=Bilophila wadsworthia TaxID=35833 RepID=UPI00242CF202|nr:cupin domain-containing protein [Bilophila wadsworthia]